MARTSRSMLCTLAKILLVNCFSLQISSDANQKLVQNAEQFGQLLAQTLSEEVPETIKTKENIGTLCYRCIEISQLLCVVIKAEIATVDVIEKLEGKPLKFPDEDDKAQIKGTFDGLDAQIAIPAELLSEALDATSNYVKNCQVVLYHIYHFRWSQIASCKYSV